MKLKQYIHSIVYFLSFQSQLADRRFFIFDTLSSRLLLLIGTSSSGKSATADALIARAPEIKVLDFDKDFHANVISSLQKYNEAIFKRVHDRYGLNSLHIIFNCYDAKKWLQLGLTSHQFKSYQSRAIKIAKVVAHTTRKRISESARRLVCNYFTVICFIAGKKSYFDYKGAFTTNILVYCSLETLRQRVAHRNQQASANHQLMNLRDIDMVESQYNTLIPACIGMGRCIPITIKIDTEQHDPSDCATMILNRIKNGR